MEEHEKIKLIISLRNIIKALEITEEELFGDSNSTEKTSTASIKEPELKPNAEDIEQKDFDEIDDDFMSNKHSVDMSDFLKRHPDSSITIASDKALESVKPEIVSDLNEDVDPSIVDDDFGGKK